MLIGRLNPESGNPEIVLVNDRNEETIIARGSYEGFAWLDDEVEGTLMVLGAFWEGKVSKDKIGTLLEVDRVGK